MLWRALLGKYLDKCGQREEMPTQMSFMLALSIGGSQLTVAYHMMIVLPTLTISRSLTDSAYGI